MKIITDNNRLLALVPNVAITVEGEQTLLDKLTPWLNTAEQWVENKLTGENVLTDIAVDPTTNVWQQVAGLIVAEALRQAIPSLDLVLTPNGFGIVSTQDVAPASKERVERLIDKMTARRDYLIDMLIDSLMQRQDWQETPQRAWFAQSLLQWPKMVVTDVCGNNFDGDRWAKFLELRGRAVNIEAEIAERWVSDELMQRLRDTVLDSNTDVDDMHLAGRVARCVLDELQGLPRKTHVLDRIVDYIRKRPDEYPEWQESTTARLFEPPLFRNKKESTGYFF